MSDLFGNPKDRFSHDEAQIIFRVRHQPDRATYSCTKLLVPMYCVILQDGMGLKAKTYSNLFHFSPKLEHFYFPEKRVCLALRFVVVSQETLNTALGFPQLLYSWHLS